MRLVKQGLLVATMMAGLASGTAHAQVVLAAPDTADGALHGAGATAIVNVFVRNQNCIGADRKAGSSTSSTALSIVSPGVFAGTPSLDCSAEANNIQPNVATEYVGTGSGFGRQAWKEFADDFDGATPAGQTITTGVFNPFGTVTRWPHLQFAFSDSSPSQAELATYNTKAAPNAGPAISFPMFVIPIAIAFDPEYGLNAKGHPMVFNTQGKGINGTTTINLSKAAYCGIFNGTITNWNDPLLTKLNKKIPLVDPINDTFTAATAKTAASGRWATDGVPIRLVGRLDGAGTTDVFTRHLASVCNTTNGYTGPNYYLQHANFLPYNASSIGGVDFSTIRSDSNYKPGAAASNFAGTTNLVSGDYWNGSAIANIAAGTPTAAPVGSVGSGLYIVANGNGALAKLLVHPADYTLNGVKLNGKIGYVSADFIQPSVDAPGGLQAAALQVGTGATFALPTVKAALNGFTQLPPESDALGAYLPGSDTRQVTAITGSTKVAATRTNPLAWAGVLYADPANTLADPQVAGSYPITGTDAFFGYTCYTTNNRLALVNTLGLTLGQINKNSANITISKAIFGGTVPANPGIDVQSNIGIVPKSWTNAIAQTFLKKGDAGAAGLYIQDALVATAAKGDPAKPKTYKPQVDPQPNPICSGITGA